MKGATADRVRPALIGRLASAEALALAGEMLFAPDIDLDEIRPKPLPARNHAFRGEMARTVLNMLRQARKPLPAHDIALAFMASRSLAARISRSSASSRSVWARPCGISATRASSVPSMARHKRYCGRSRASTRALAFFDILKGRIEGLPPLARRCWPLSAACNSLRGMGEVVTLDGQNWTLNPELVSAAGRPLCLSGGSGL